MCCDRQKQGSCQNLMFQGYISWKLNEGGLQRLCYSSTPSEFWCLPASEMIMSWFSMRAAFLLVPPLERLPAVWVQHFAETVKRSYWQSAACELLLYYCNAESPRVKWSVVRFLTLHPTPAPGSLGLTPFCTPPTVDSSVTFLTFIVTSTCLSLLAVWARLIVHSDTRLTRNGPYVWFMSHLCLEKHAGLKTAFSSSSPASLAWDV